MLKASICTSCPDCRKLYPISRLQVIRYTKEVIRRWNEIDILNCTDQLKVIPMEAIFEQYFDIFNDLLFGVTLCRDIMRNYQQSTEASLPKAEHNHHLRPFKNRSLERRWRWGVERGETDREFSHLRYFGLWLYSSEKNTSWRSSPRGAIIVFLPRFGVSTDLMIQFVLLQIAFHSRLIFTCAF